MAGVDGTAVTVRLLEEADLEEVVEMIRGLSTHHGDVSRVTVETLRRDALGAAPWAQVHVAEVDGQLAGYMALIPLAWLHYGDRGMEIYHLFVQPVWRRVGVGAALIERAKAVARTAGCVELKVGTHPANGAAMGYYLSQGFVEQPQIGARFRFPLQSVDILGISRSSGPDDVVRR